MVLNASYQPIKVISWQKAIVLWFQEKVDVLEFQEVEVRSPSRGFKLPSVLRLKSYSKHLFNRQVKFNRQNIFVRDHFTCQYCAKKLSEKKLTVDHVVPLSKGGTHEWSNVVAACGTCNNKKGNKSLEQANLKLKKKPDAPGWIVSTQWELNTNRVPDEWRPYLFLEY